MTVSSAAAVRPGRPAVRVRVADGVDVVEGVHVDLHAQVETEADARFQIVALGF